MFHYQLKRKHSLTYTYDVLSFIFQSNHMNLRRKKLTSRFWYVAGTTIPLVWTFQSGQYLKEFRTVQLDLFLTI